MATGWQDIVALGIISLAVLYLCKLAAGALFRKNASGCAVGCAKCSMRPRTGVRITQQLATIGGQVHPARPQVGRGSPRR